MDATTSTKKKKKVPTIPAHMKYVTKPTRQMLANKVRDGRRERSGTYYYFIWKEGGGGEALEVERTFASISTTLTATNLS